MDIFALQRHYLHSVDYCTAISHPVFYRATHSGACRFAHYRFQPYAEVNEALPNGMIKFIPLPVYCFGFLHKTFLCKVL